MADNKLDITLLNLDGTQNLYIGSSAPANQLTLLLTNNSQQAVTFQSFSGESGLTINSITQSDSAIFLLLNGLVSNAVINQITVTPAGGWLWQIQQDDQNGNYITFYPQYTTTTINPGNSISFVINFPQIITSSNNGYFLCQYVNVISYGEYYSEGEQLYISLAYPPFSTGGGTSIPLQFDIVGNNILYNDQTPQSLTLRITNTGSSPLVPQGTAGWDMSNTPLFEISFVTGGDQTAGVLLNQANYSAYNLNNGNLYGNDYPTPVSVSGSNPLIWQLRPYQYSTAGGYVLGTGSAASITLNVTGLKTDMPPGISSAILSYRGIPGYDDGQLTAEIVVMEPALQIVYFTAQYKARNISNNMRTQVLAFSVVSAASVSISQNGSNIYSSPSAPVDNQGYTVDITVDASSVFVLTATSATGESISREVLVWIDTMPIGAIIAWYGSRSSLPYGWGLCDGGTYYGMTTPNLTSKFLVSASADDSREVTNGGYYKGQTGGTATHTHSFNVPQQVFNSGSAGSHSHTTNFNGTRNVKDNDGYDSDNTYFHGGNTGADDTVVATDSEGSHQHSVTVPAQSNLNTGSGNNLPPYFALYYIMRCV